MVECQLPKLKVAGSNPVSRSRKINGILRGSVFRSPGYHQNFHQGFEMVGGSSLREDIRAEVNLDFVGILLIGPQESSIQFLPDVPNLPSYQENRGEKG